MKLFIDTCNWKLVLILKKDDQIVDSLILPDTKKVSDIVLSTITMLLSKNNLKINDIEEFYLTNGPGSYTGVRVGLTIVKTLKTLNNEIKVYLMNSLAFQASNDKIISVLDARGNKYYLGVYENQKPLIKETVVSLEELEDIKKTYNDFIIKKDNESVDYLETFNLLEDKFILVNEIEEISPLYIKNFI
ncbi:tRNA (adenosine(37)-N6)-threonylcarbamoyltransferase complex dimerization subunit type 1 TsaB [Mesoplasma entomophilum]|uniref:tRNA (adenosine(37)-N6)-threonylcarbamoyltransferase complex dimerization subunit type 1 TsaB n=1 Tax=Mesoplasma entomophilum TaxID=2149 RepID=UPI000D036E0D|nr:tRNA (adenosine(37)-N6)-threonylcarbamoyltransferase complex dimerization subunit type 1 TsaB [Mesoplasma entomophilum]AVN60500.1 tRNA (adenosine(37)-N6)-threonylcarbamoyltransferase complex dimerization subunit type 1 TsaB [Mesoplasma entomophilum]